MQLTRRQFVVAGTGVLVGLGALGATQIAAQRLPLAPAAGPAPAGGATPTGAKVDDRTLVVIFLAGGNDGLNTVIPYGVGHYYDLRPNLSIPQAAALPLNDTFGLHPSLAGLKQLYDQGQVAVLNNVGYPKPNRSHFLSMDIWATAIRDGVAPTGWLGRYLDVTRAMANNPLAAVAIGNTVPRPLIAGTGSVPSLEALSAFDIAATPAYKAQLVNAVHEMYAPDGGPLVVVRQKGAAAYDSVEAVKRIVGNYQSTVAYPAKSRLADNLKLVTQLLAGGSRTKVFFATQGGYDEHASEKNHHGNLLKEFGDAVAAFYQDLAAHGLQDRVVTLAYSEFGRRVKENANGGTDHGAAGPSLLIGPAVSGGIYGGDPDLTNLVDGDLKYSIDFRAVYATLLERWLGVPSREILKDTFQPLSLLRL